jgi:hypothetical protein
VVVVRNRASIDAEAARLATVVLLATAIHIKRREFGTALERSRSPYFACSSPGAGSAAYDVKE